MTKYLLKVPTTNKPKDWFSFINESLNHIGAEILIVDFQKINFLNTTHFVLLACLIESFFIKKCNIKFRGGTTKLNNHLNNIKFKEYWNEGFNRNSYTNPSNKTTLCLWKVSKEMIYDYSKYTTNYLKAFANNKDLNPISINLLEIFNNIFDHSESKVTGYVIAQYYPKKKLLTFSVCDFGKGISNALKESNNFEKRRSDWEAIIESLKQGVSTMSTPQNRGMGLSILTDSITELKGNLYIYSNNGVVVKYKGEKFFKCKDSDFRFSGTLIKVEINLERLEDKDYSEEIYDF